jgi:DsbC/DsbD-like thiol-disulfide interchange protein
MGLVAVSYDPVAVLADFSERRHITFPLLSDEGSKVIRQYGLLNTSVAQNNATFGIPYPGTFMLDRNGVVTSRFFEAAYQERNTMTSMLVKLGAKLDIAATRIAAPHATVTTYLTDQAAAPGTHFSAVLDIAPEKSVHVYAPGVSGYKPIAVTIAPQPGLVVRAVQFPKSEDYFFKPLNEHVPVFQKPFRVAQDLEIDPSQQAAASLQGQTSMTITGTLEYQACDDKICFTPQSVPLSWTIGLKPLDRERVNRP